MNILCIEPLNNNSLSEIHCIVYLLRFKLNLQDRCLIIIFLDRCIHIWHRKHIMDIFMKKKHRFVEYIRSLGVVVPLYRYFSLVI